MEGSFSLLPLVNHIGGVGDPDSIIGWAVAVLSRYQFLSGIGKFNFKLGLSLISLLLSSLPEEMPPLPALSVSQPFGNRSLPLDKGA